MLSPDLLKILVCPGCKGKIEHVESDDGESLICHACKLRFNIIDNIPIMRLDKAESLEGAKDSKE
jgi:uncharacterized protein YbaR (Trm112 family)